MQITIKSLPVCKRTVFNGEQPNATHTPRLGFVFLNARVSTTQIAPVTAFFHICSVYLDRNIPILESSRENDTANLSLKLKRNKALLVLSVSDSSQIPEESSLLLYVSPTTLFKVQCYLNGLSQPKHNSNERIQDI